jgi:hypothetical protein
MLMIVALVALPYLERYRIAETLEPFDPLYDMEVFTFPCVLCCWNFAVDQPHIQEIV